MEANIIVETDTEHPNETIVKLRFIHDAEESVNIGQLKQMVFELIQESETR